MCLMHTRRPCGGRFGIRKERKRPVPLNIVKLAVGVETPDDLARIQARLVEEDLARGGKGVLRHFTRNAPKRAREILGGGSLYRVIKGVILLRQKILAIEPGHRPDGRPACVFQLDPVLISVRPKPMRPFQGWRYLRQEDAPEDIAGTGGSNDLMPSEMAAELRELGLL